ncbi:hypothetical protein [Marinimicrobium sp. ABcell2]|uniref:DUF748 domain-containing protein n=1 Tax=Marinimicrobium sp. ABcell2 TaxID=3069751 RepID=UPI0027AFC211|nr:hypothetical protein [Marinimicrobium sp. ABcell2]MDQ2075502.1 hypothetical protein [Marinimicrobium sp. ABcell2]
MKAIKIILSVLVALLIVIAIALLVGLRNLDALVEVAIESIGTHVTQTEVTVERVNIELTEARGTVYGLTVANPEGFTEPYIFQVGEVSLQILPASLTEKVLVLPRIVIDGAELHAEHAGVADINIHQMVQNIQRDVDEEAKATTASPDVRFMVEELRFTNATLNLLSGELGERRYTMDDIHLTDLGDREEGLTPAQLTRAILAPLLEQARQRVEGELRDEATGAVRERLEEELSDDDRDRLRSILDR